MLLIGNIAILISVSIIFNFISRHWNYNSLQYRVLNGILFGLTAIIGMIASAKVIPGVFFDGRSIILSIAGIFAGPLPAIIAVVIATIFRFFIGGTGVYMGVLVIVVSAGIGVLFHKLKEQKIIKINTFVLLVIGYLVHFGMLACTLALPSPLRIEMIHHLLFPVLVVYPAGFLLVGMLFIDQENRLRSLDQLSQSEHRYKQLVENTRLIIVKLNVKGEVVYINNYGLGLLGYSRHEVIGRQAHDLLILKNDPGSPFFTEIGQRLIGTQNSLTTEGICHTKMKEPLTILWVLTKTMGDADTPELLCMGNNITGLVGVQEALRVSQLTLKSIMDNTNDLICQVDPEGKHQYVSPSYKKIFGYETQDILGQSFFSFLHPHELTFAISEFKKGIVSKKLTPLKARFRAKSGNYVWIESHGNTIVDKDGRVTGVVISSRDITEQVKYQNKIEESEFRYKTLLNAIPDLLFVQTNDGVYLDFHCNNDSMLIMSPEDFVGKKDVDVLPSKILSLFEEKFRLVRMHGNIEKFEYPTRLKNGQEGFFEARVTTFGPDKMLTIIRDITDRKKVEQLIIESKNLLTKKNEEYIAINEELNRSNVQIQSINNELIKAKEKAEESDRLKSAFLANMSHEIRTPMNGLLGFAELLRRHNLSDEKRRLYIDIINSNGSQLLAIINDIIDISKIEAGQVVADIKAANITNLFLEIQNQFSTLAKSRSLEFVAHYPDTGDIIAKTDIIKLRQILFNLLNNALKFTHEGRVEAGFSVIDGYLLFYVMDTGIGIPKDLHATVFERFRQVEDSISLQQGGTGLGLSISKSLVELLGGTIWLDSELGKGSTFFFTIPFVEGLGEPIISNEIKISSQSSWIGKVVLIAEDDESNYNYLSTIISEVGIQSIRAVNGQEAVDCCKGNQTIDLALIDVRMPMLDGYETTRKIKELRSSLPVVIHTAFVSTDGKTRAYNAGCDEFLPKPISRKEVIELFNRFFN